jgi:hypothetical protein
MSDAPNTPDLPKVVAFNDLDHTTPPEPTFIIEQLVPANVTTLLAAHGGTGKTTLALAAAVCLAAGLPFLGKKVVQSAVVFYSAEDDAAQLRVILARVCKAYGVMPSSLDGRLTIVDASATDCILFVEKYEAGTRSGVTTNAFDLLKQCYLSTKSQVLIVDNASDVYAANEIDRASVSRFIRSLTRLVQSNGGAAILLSHVDKVSAQQKRSESYSGSTAWNNAVRSRLSLTAQQGGLLLQQLKSNRGMLAEDISLIWRNAVPTMINPAGSLSLDDISQAEADRKAILILIAACNARGETLSVEPQARNNAYKLLKSEKTFPRSIRRADDLWPVLRDLQDQGLLNREVYQDSYRKSRIRWVVAPSALTAPTSGSLDENMKEQEAAPSAPSSEGGTGGERSDNAVVTPDLPDFDFSELDLSSVVTANSLAH